MEYLNLTEASQLESLDANSFEGKGVLIFKHSIRCIISKMVWRDFQASWSNDLDNLPVYYLDLINYRSLSQAVAEGYSVHHESPQLLWIKNGKCVYHNSHHGIRVEDIKELVNA